jgi:NAD-dependent SIR2 family protein deacetylase
VPRVDVEGSRMTPELFKVTCPDCYSTDEHIEVRGHDEHLDLCGACSVCGHFLDENVVVYNQVMRQIRIKRETPEQRARSIVDAVRNLFTNPEYNRNRDSELL